MSDTAKEITLINAQIDNITISYCKPENPVGITLWIPYLGGNREDCAAELEYIAAHNYVGITLDPWMHGSRAENTKPGIRTRALKDFRKIMWQVLGLTTIDAYKIMDWAVNEFNIDKNITVGGLSMGGDIALSLAGLDARIKKVAGVASSPDWNRKGMTDVMDSTKIIDQGIPSEFSSWLCSQFNPMNNSDKYTREISIQLEYGKKDTHILYKWAEEFKKSVEICKTSKLMMDIITNEDVNHISLIQKKGVIHRALDFLVK